ncbi:MAG: hypothetical protein ONB05_00130, partial [candidate division KSB1 bacterium]|nr:hypothetical protein [candidate division KSB1 bacterium]
AKFFENEKAFQAILTARNHSILAHGQKAITKDTFDKFLNLLLDTFSITQTVEFPALNWDV